jgi:hypothetical protein
MAHPASVHSDFLNRHAVRPTTLARYRSALRVFVAWARSSLRPGGLTFDQLDVLLCDYFHHLYFSRYGAGKGLAACTLSGLTHFYPGLRGHLPVASQALLGWRRLRPAVSYPPMLWPVVCSVAFQLLGSGHLGAAIGVLVAYDGYLRISELSALCFRDITFPSGRLHASMSTSTALVIRMAKTGYNQRVVLRDPAVQRLLAWFVSRCRPALPSTSPLFPDAASFRSAFRRACDELRLDPRYVVHSLRHGHATSDLLDGIPVRDIMVRGRWRSLEGARTYLQAGAALVFSTTVPDTVRRAGLRFSTDLLTYFSFALKQLRRANLGVD